MGVGKILQAVYFAHGRMQGGWLLRFGADRETFLETPLY